MRGARVRGTHILKAAHFYILIDCLCKIIFILGLDLSIKKLKNK
jgi:hypothetical protein